jgi:hypothetical protein
MCFMIQAPGGLLQPSLMFAQPYTRVEHLKDASLGLAPGLLANIRQGWNGLPGTKTSLLTSFISYREN